MNIYMAFVQYNDEEYDNQQVLITVGVDFKATYAVLKQALNDLSRRTSPLNSLPRIEEIESASIERYEVQTGLRLEVIKDYPAKPDTIYNFDKSGNPRLPSDFEAVLKDLS